MTHPYGTQTGRRGSKSRGAGSPRRKGRNVIEAVGAETPPPIKKAQVELVRAGGWSPITHLSTGFLKLALVGL